MYQGSPPWPFTKGGEIFAFCDMSHCDVGSLKLWKPRQKALDIFTLRSAFWSCFGRSVKLSKLWAILQGKISINLKLHRTRRRRSNSKDGERPCNSFDGKTVARYCCRGWDRYPKHAAKKRHSIGFQTCQKVSIIVIPPSSDTLNPKSFKSLSGIQKPKSTITDGGSTATHSTVIRGLDGS